MKANVIDQVKVEYEPGVMITVKQLRLPDGKTEQRYFIYGVEGWNLNAGGFGWTSLEKMIQRFEWYKKQGWVKISPVKPQPERVTEPHPFFA